MKSPHETRGAPPMAHHITSAMWRSRFGGCHDPKEHAPVQHQTNGPGRAALHLHRENGGFI